jgi:hypothetical protein
MNTLLIIASVAALIGLAISLVIFYKLVFTKNFNLLENEEPIN